MIHRKRFPGSYVLAAILSVAVLAGQTAKPARDPDVPYVPTTEQAVQAMLKLAGVKKTDVVYDLGCGDGRIVIAAAKNYGARAVGIDINPVRIAEAKENARKAGVEKLVRFEEKDLFQADIHEATVVTLFLLPTVNMKLRPKLLQDLKPGTRVVSNTFDMGDWKPDKEATVGGVDDVEAPLSRDLYLWVIPQAKKK
jgi:SAM-dependent methyltransferase